MQFLQIIFVLICRRAKPMMLLHLQCMCPCNYRNDSPLSRQARGLLHCLKTHDTQVVLHSILSMCLTEKGKTRKPLQVISNEQAFTHKNA